MGGTFARTGLPNPVSTAAYNANNQLTTWGTANLFYDANGNMTSNGTDGYTWDARNHLVSTLSGATFQYDGFGRRISKTIGGTTTSFLYDGVNAVQEVIGGINTANSLMGGIDEIFQRTDSAGARSFLTDSLGSSLGLTDSAGTLQTQYTFEPFGNTTTSGSATTNTFAYTARELDATGLYFYRARYYNPNLGRFMSEDPLGFKGDINGYRYALDSPVSLSDPSGLKASVACLRCFGVGSMSCIAAQDDTSVLHFDTNFGKNEASGTPGDPFGDNGPLPPGSYDLVNAYSPKFGRTLPSPTNTGVPGEVVTPLGTNRAGIRVHKGSYSRGCLTLGNGSEGDQLENSIRELVDNNAQDGGTSLRIVDGPCQ